jgi:hypothetical protein
MELKQEHDRALADFETKSSEASRIAAHPESTRDQIDAATSAWISRTPNCKRPRHASGWTRRSSGRRRSTAASR